MRDPHVGLHFLQGTPRCSWQIQELLEFPWLNSDWIEANGFAGHCVEIKRSALQRPHKAAALAPVLFRHRAVTMVIQEDGLCDSFNFYFSFIFSFFRTVIELSQK